MTCPYCKIKYEAIAWPFHCRCGAIIREDGSYRPPVVGYGVPKYVGPKIEKEIIPPSDLDQDIVEWLALGQKLKEH